MRVKRIASLAAATLMIGALTACSSGVKRNGDVAGQPMEQAASAPLQVAGLNVTFSNDAKEQYRDNLKFDPVRFKDTIERTLSGLELVKADSTNQLAVTITDVRVRSTFSAVMWGFMAGSDSIDGRVEVQDANGKVLRSFDVSASYALGGIAGGTDDTRLNWLYEEFAKLTAQELGGSAAQASKQ